MSNFYKFLITAVAVVAALYFIILPLGIRILAYYLHHRAVNSPERVVSFSVPDTSATLTFYSRPDHAFLAEFKRRLTLEQPGQPIIEKELTWDTGGRDWVAVYGVKRSDQMKIFVIDGWANENTTSTVESKADDPEFASDSDVYTAATVPAHSYTDTTLTLQLGIVNTHYMQWSPDPQITDAFTTAVPVPVN